MLAGYAKRDGAYRQWDLGFSAGHRTVGKDDFCGSINKHLGAHDPYAFWLQNQTARRRDGTTLSGFDALCACYNLAKWGGQGKDKNHRQQQRDCDAASFAQELYWDDYIARQAVALLHAQEAAAANGSSQAPPRPWMLQVNFMDPHPPFVVTSAMAAATANRSWPPSVDAGNKTALTDICSTVPGGVGIGTGWERCNYGAELEHLDRLFGQVLGAVVDVETTTVVCVSSDHGEMLVRPHCHFLLDCQHMYCICRFQAELILVLCNASRAIMVTLPSPGHGNHPLSCR